MAKIAFMGAGSSVFAKNILGDSMLSPALHDAHIALYDVDETRLDQSRRILETLNRNINKGRAKITAHLGKSQRKTALRNAAYVVNAIQVGGYEPSTVVWTALGGVLEASWEVFWESWRGLFATP